MVKVYTRTGDTGDTALFDGTRVPKTDPRVEVYGTVDELNSVLSLARVATTHDDVRAIVRDIQRYLFVVGGDLATPPGEGKAAGAVRRVGPADVATLEAHIDTYWARLTTIDAFVVPGETETAARFHIARCVCRRAERLAVALAADEPVGAPVIQYLNRLSDLLFTLGRYEDEGQAPPDRIGGLKA